MKKHEFVAIPCSCEEQANPVMKTSILMKPVTPNCMPLYQLCDMYFFFRIAHFLYQLIINCLARTTENTGTCTSPGRNMYLQKYDKVLLLCFHIVILCENISKVNKAALCHIQQISNKLQYRCMPCI